MRKEGFLEITNIVVGVIASLASLLSAILPIFSKKVLDYLIIDGNVIVFTSIAGIVILLFTGWFSTSLDFFILLNKENNAIKKMAEYRLASLAGITISVLLLYVAKLLYISESINFLYGTLIQILSYMVMYLLLGLHIGIAFQTTMQTSKNKKLNEEKVDKMLELLIKYGHLPIKILSISPINSKPNEMGAVITNNLIRVEIGEKKYQYIASFEMDNILLSEEINEYGVTSTIDGGPIEGVTSNVNNVVEKNDSNSTERPE